MGFSWRFLVHRLSRMDTAITLLIVLALAASSGTALTQNLGAANYAAAIGPFWTQVFTTLGITDVYRSPWFIAGLVMLFVSVTSCVWRNGPQLWQQVIKPRKVTPRWLQVQAAAVAAGLEPVNIPKKLTYKSEKSSITLYQKGIYHRIGYFLTHIGVLVLVVGGALTALGWRGQVLLPPGLSTSSAYIVKGDEISQKELPFSLKMADFKIDYLPSGQPASFASEVALQLPAQPAVSRTITVNKPLRKGGYRLFQASYGDAGSAVDFYVTELVSNQQSALISGQVYQNYTVLAGGYQISLTAVHETAPEPILAAENQRNPATVNFGPAVDYVLNPATTSPLQLRAYLNQPTLFGLGDGAGNFSPVYLGVDVTNPVQRALLQRVLAAPEQERTQAGFVEWLAEQAKPLLMQLPPEQRLPTALAVLQAANVLSNVEVPALLVPTQLQPRYFSHLMVTYDPGAPVFWAGCLLLFIGVLLVLYTSYVRVWVVQGAQRQVYIKANRPLDQVQQKYLQPTKEFGERS